MPYLVPRPPTLRLWVYLFASVWLSPWPHPTEIQKNKTMETLFEQYDVSKTGYLSMAEVARFLQDAAKGATPTEEEVGSGPARK